MKSSIDSGLLTAAKRDTLLAFVSELQGTKFDFCGRGKTKGATNIFRDERAARFAKKEIRNWLAPSWLKATQI